VSWGFVGTATSLVRMDPPRAVDTLAQGAADGAGGCLLDARDRSQTPNRQARLSQRILLSIGIHPHALPQRNRALLKPSRAALLPTPLTQTHPSLARPPCDRASCSTPVLRGQGWVAVVCVRLQLPWGESPCLRDQPCLALSLRGQQRGCGSRRRVALRGVGLPAHRCASTCAAGTNHALHYHFLHKGVRIMTYDPRQTYK